jgi:predicted CXXCH cytochrome family protein
MKIPPPRNYAFLLLVLCLVVGAIWLIGIEPVFAQPTIPHPIEGNDDCLACHETGVSGAPQFPDDHAGRTNETCMSCHMEGLEQNPPVVPHPLENREDCLACHQEGIGGAPQVPADHEGRVSESCLVCHTPAMTEEAPGIPHTLEGREDCLACHSPGPVDDTEGEEEPVTAPAPAELSLPEPLTYPEPVGDANSCFSCHIGQEGMTGVPARNWQNSIHAKRGVICADCHGGDPNAMTKDEAMSRAAGFVGKPSRTDIPGLCGSCHANVTMMRQYDLPTDQFAQYRESQHGHLLAQGDTAVATCFDCHDQHSTYETNDPKSSVYPFNVPALCARCHADEDYMASYDIPTNQYDLYKESVHGEALLDEQDTRAPSCATCHGTHGAAPPGFAEVANVCGGCHTATQDYYLSGAHNSDGEDVPLCVTCHGRYDVQEPSEALFEGGEPRHCGSCHASDSQAGMTVARLQNALVTADEALEKANETVDQAARLGMIVAEEESLMTEARTRLITARAAQHTVNEDVVFEETDASVELSNQAADQATQAIQQSRFRRRAMIIAVAVIVLIIVSLVLLRRELVSSRTGENT